MKKLGYFFTVIALSILGFSFIGSAAEPKYGGKLVVGQDLDAIGLDPQKALAFSSWTYFELVYNSLLQVDEKGNLQPDLAVSWETPDPQTYVFHLRKGVKFHDGTEFSSEDVKATFDRLMDPKTASPRRKNFKLLNRIEPMGRYTVRFTLEKPFAPFLSYMGFTAYSSILSKNVIEKADPGKMVVGTAAFKMEEYRPNDKMILKKNPFYWEKGLPYLDEIELRLIPDATSRVAALRARSADYTWIIETQLVKLLLQEKGIEHGIAADTGRMRVYLNCTKAPLNNIKVRQALSSATDRKEMIQLAAMGKANLSGPIPSAAGDFAYPPEKLPYYDYDVERAKKLLQEAGYANGFKITAKVSATYPIDQYSAQILQNQWKKIGVNLEIIKQEFGTLLRDLTTRNHDTIFITDIWRPDPDEYVEYGWGAIEERTGFTSPDLDKLVIDGTATLDHGKRMAIYHEIAKKMAEYSPVLFLYARPQRFEFWGEYVKGYNTIPSCSRVNLKKTWLAK